MDFRKKLLFGVTGIGYGHTYRQMPTIDYFAKASRMVIFAYDRSYECFRERYRNFPDVRVEKIAVPFWVGGGAGLDYEATAARKDNQDIDFLAINCRAMARAEDFIGRPDLVISDYDPVSAQYAYAFDAPLVTIDQQSKYLCGDFPPRLGGFGFQDEIVRLRMFFPRAEARIACSFFDFPRKASAPRVEVVPPVLRESFIQEAKGRRRKSSDILVYLSPAKTFSQSLREVVGELERVPRVNFHLCVAKEASQLHDRGRGVSEGRIKLYCHGDSRFSSLLYECRAVVATAGHSLLSEAMFLRTPVYAIPTEPYEQHMNSYVIEQNGFGVSESKVTHASLASFIERLPQFEEAIRSDREVLLRGAGQRRIISCLGRLM